jgi:hypothetical protein
MVCSPWLVAQQARDAGPGGLTINIVKGEGGINSIRKRSGTPIEIEVRDGQGKPVPGVQVIFRLPSFGASGSFPGGELMSRVTTGPSGNATMTGFVPNDTTGRFNIKITADSGSLSGSAVVSQINVAELASDKPKSHKTLWILLAAGAGGGAAVAIAAGKGGGSGSSSAAAVSPSVTLTPGGISVGGPH